MTLIPPAAAIFWPRTPAQPPPSSPPRLSKREYQPAHQADQQRVVGKRERRNTEHIAFTPEKSSNCGSRYDVMNAHHIARGAAYRLQSDDQRRIRTDPLPTLAGEKIDKKTLKAQFTREG